MTWNHRVLAHENDNEVTFMLHIVHYKSHIPTTYTSPITVHGESLKDLTWVLNTMKLALKKPILSVKNFPNEYEIPTEK